MQLFVLAEIKVLSVRKKQCLCRSRKATPQNSAIPCHCQLRQFRQWIPFLQGISPFGLLPYGIDRSVLVQFLPPYPKQDRILREVPSF